MNHPDAYPSSPRQNPRSLKPATISELTERAKILVVVQWDESKKFKYYLKLAEVSRRQGRELVEAGDIEGAFVKLTRAATVVLEILPEYPDYNEKLDPTQRHNLGMNGQEILDHLARLKPVLVNRSEKWRQEHPDEEDATVTPIRIHQLTDKDAARGLQKDITQTVRPEPFAFTRHLANEDAAKAQREQGHDTTRPVTPRAHIYQLARNAAQARELQMLRKDITRVLTPRPFRTHHLANEDATKAQRDQGQDITRAVTPNARTYPLANKDAAMDRQDIKRAVTPKLFARTHHLANNAATGAQQEDITRAVTPNIRTYQLAENAAKAQRALQIQRQDTTRPQDTAVTTNVRTHQLANGNAARTQLRMQQQMEKMEGLERTTEEILERDMEEMEKYLQAYDSGPGFDFLIYSSESAG